MDDEKHSGFEAPIYGTVYPKGTTFVKNPDGKLIPVLPNEDASDEEASIGNRKKDD